MTDTPTPLFAGLKVVDAASWIAAPVAATILADLGADVVKVEIPGEGDPYRKLPSGPAAPKATENYTWLMDARNKRSITVNLKHEQGRAVLHRLVAWCDVYITNQPLGMRRRLGLGYEDLKGLNARMIYASLTAYGEVGDEAEREGFDTVAYWARAGLMDLVRAPGAAPSQSVPGMGDHPTGVALYASIVTALYRRQFTGEGGLVHTSLLANGFWANGCLGQAALVGADFSPRDRIRTTPANFTRVPFEAADGRFVQLNMVRGDDDERAVLAALDLADLLHDARFANKADRDHHAHALVDLLAPVFASRPAVHWMKALSERNVPVSLVATTQDMLHDQQAIANDVLVKPSDPRVNAPFVINHPVRVEGIASAGPTKAPDVGEHSDQVLGELGYNATQIAALREAGAI